MLPELPSNHHATQRAGRSSLCTPYLWHFRDTHWGDGRRYGSLLTGYCLPRMRPPLPFVEALPSCHGMYGVFCTMPHYDVYSMRHFEGSSADDGATREQKSLNQACCTKYSCSVIVWLGGPARNGDCQLGRPWLNDFVPCWTCPCRAAVQRDRQSLVGSRRRSGITYHVVRTPRDSTMSPYRSVQGFGWGLANSLGWLALSEVSKTVQAGHEYVGAQG